MGNATGTPRRVTLDGVTFSVMGDSNFSAIKGKYTNEEVITTGGNVKKATLRAQKVESITLQCNSEEADLLRVLSERKGNFPMSYETASGDVFRAVGFINYETHDTESGTAAIQMIPESQDGFALFVA